MTPNETLIGKVQPISQLEWTIKASYSEVSQRDHYSNEYYWPSLGTDGVKININFDSKVIPEA